jgi:hypothetical protein
MHLAISFAHSMGVVNADTRAAAPEAFGAFVRRL